MNEFFNSATNNSANNHDELFAFLATNSEINKLALKIQANQKRRLNLLNIRKNCIGALY